MSIIDNKYVLLDRTNWYLDLAEEIKRAEKLAVIDNYIWVNDEVGNILAQAVLEAAEKGVTVFIRNDTFGAIFEHTPAGRVPFFFDESFFAENFWKSFYQKEVGLLTMRNFNRLGYLAYGCKERPKLAFTESYLKMRSHRNIIIQSKPFFNHGKIVIIDDRIAYIGGQCIAKDYKEWVDYNQKIIDQKIVRKILLKLLGKDTFTADDNVIFLNNDSLGVNRKKCIYRFIKSFIRSAKDDLFIEMVYLGLYYIKAIKKLIKKKIHVHILVPEKADTNQHTNMSTLARLLRATKNSPYLHIVLFDKMMHTKGLATRSEVVLGSTNFHSAKGHLLSVDEQNFYSKDQRIVKPIMSRFLEDFKNGREAHKMEDLPAWNPGIAFLEQLGVWLNSYFAVIFGSKIIKARLEAKRTLARLLKEKRIMDAGQIVLLKRKLPMFRRIRLDPEYETAKIKF